LPSFKYSETRSWDYAPVANTLTLTEISNFGELNQMVRDSQPNTNAITALIDRWYSGNYTDPPVKPAVPSSWNVVNPINGQTPAQVVNAYHNVFGKSCRTCHVARDEGNDDAPLLFNDAVYFSNRKSVVCGSPKVMPNAFVTYKNFWSDPQRVINYRALTGTNITNCN